MISKLIPVLAWLGNAVVWSLVFQMHASILLDTFAVLWLMVVLLLLAQSIIFLFSKSLS